MGRWYTDKVALGFIAAVIVIGLLTATTCIVAQGAVSASKWVSHTQEVLKHLSQLRSDALDIELTTQNYRLTGDDALIARRNDIITAREGRLQDLARALGDNPAQMLRFAQLRTVIAERVQLSRTIERIRKTEGREAAALFVAAAPLETTRVRMHALLQELDIEEASLLAQRTARETAATRLVLLADMAAAVVLSLMLLMTYRLIRRQERVAEAGRRAFAENAERLSITLSSIGDAVLSTDIGGCIVDMNPVAERLTGWLLADARGHPVEQVFKIIHEVTRAPAASPVAQVLATGGAHELDAHTVLVARDGREIPIAHSAAPIQDGKRRLTGVVLAFRDETMARQARRSALEQNELLERHVQERTAQMRESEDHLRSVINNVPAMIAFVDRHQRYVYANRQYSDCFGPGQADIAGMTVRELLGDERYAIASPRIARALAGEELHYDWQPFPDVWQQIHYVPRRDAADNVTGYYVLGTDITARKGAEQEIQALNSRLTDNLASLEHVTRALRTLSAGNRSLLHAQDEMHLLESMCQAIVSAGGYRMACVWYSEDGPPHTLVPMAQCGHPGGLAEVQLIAAAGGGNPDGQTAVATAIRTGLPRIVRRIQEDPAYAPWSRYTPIYGCCVASPMRIDGRVVGALAIYAGKENDLSDDEVALLTESADDMAFGIAVFRARAEKAATEQAMHRVTYFDAVTDLPNGVMFAQTVAAAIEEVKNGTTGFTLLQANVERLREINEGLGTEHGDDLLRQFGQRLCGAVPARAVVARLRGKEFAVFLPESRSGDALLLAQSLDVVLGKPFQIAGLNLGVAARIGIAEYPAQGNTAIDLLRQIDIAVGQARKQDVRHALFNPSYGEGQAKRMVMIGELRHAIEAGELALYLQPKVDMRSRRVVGAEALVRWRHPVRGMILPGEFIPLAESSLLIQPLTDWVIRAALEINKSWQAEGSALPIAVNLSAHNLRDDGLVEHIRVLLKAAGTLPGLLEIELTESMLMEQAHHSLAVLHALRALDIALYIDDFGTGYSSLNYLQQMPVDYIKIDQSFVRQMIEREDSAAIVKATIDLAHELRLQVVAEGVETQAQWDRLVEYGCDFAQGYLIARPMPPDEFLRWSRQYAAA